VGGVSLGIVIPWHNARPRRGIPSVWAAGPYDTV
jgi:hypothetical protein